MSADHGRCTCDEPDAIVRCPLHSAWAQPILTEMPTPRSGTQAMTWMEAQLYTRWKVTEALLGCAHEIETCVSDLMRKRFELVLRESDRYQLPTTYGHRILWLLAYNPLKLIELVPATGPIIKAALAKHGLSLENLK